MRTDSSRQADGERFLQQIRSSVARALPTGCTLVGPLPSAMPRRAGKFRCQLMAHSESRSAIQRCASALVRQAEAIKAPRDLKWSIDIDPQEIL